MELLINKLSIKEIYTAIEINELTNRLIIDYERAYRNGGNLDLFVIRINLGHFVTDSKKQISGCHIRNFVRYLNLLKQNPIKNPTDEYYNEGCFQFQRRLNLFTN